MTHNEIETIKCTIKLALLTSKVGKTLLEGMSVQEVLTASDEFLAVLDDMKDKAVTRTSEPPTVPQVCPKPWSKLPTTTFIQQGVPLPEKLDFGGQSRE